MKGQLITFGKSTFKRFVPDMGHETCGNVDIVPPPSGRDILRTSRHVRVPQGTTQRSLDLHAA